MEVLKSNWKVVIPVIIVFAAAALMESIQVHDDTWYHLLVGRYIYTHQSVPTTGFLVYNHEASPMIYHSWLAQLFFYMVYKMGGLFCLEMIGAVLSVLIGLMFTYLGLKYFSRQAFLLLLPFIMLFTLPFLNLRPNILSLIFFTVLFIVADRGRQKPTAGLFAGMILILLVWSQVHGFWVYGLAVIALFAVSAYVDGEKEKAYFFTGVLPVSLGLITVLFILIHNRSDFLMDLLHSGVNIRHNEVVEWLSPFWILQRYFSHDNKLPLFLVFKFFFVPFLMAVLTVLSLIYKKRALPDYLLGLFFTGLILYSYRNMMFTVPVFIFITGPVVDDILKEKRKIGAVLIGTSIIVAIGLTGFFVSQKMSDEPLPADPLPLENRKRKIIPTLQLR